MMMLSYELAAKIRLGLGKSNIYCSYYIDESTKFEVRFTAAKRLDVSKGGPEAELFL